VDGRVDGDPVRQATVSGRLSASTFRTADFRHGRTRRRPVRRAVEVRRPAGVARRRWGARAL